MKLTIRKCQRKQQWIRTNMIQHKTNNRSLFCFISFPILRCRSRKEHTFRFRNIWEIELTNWLVLNITLLYITINLLLFTICKKKKLLTHRIENLFRNCANNCKFYWLKNGGLSKKEGFIYDLQTMIVCLLKYHSFSNISDINIRRREPSILVYLQCQTFGNHHCQLSGPPAGQVGHWWSLIISNFEKRHYWPTCATRRIDTLCPLNEAESLLTCK